MKKSSHLLCRSLLAALFLGASGASVHAIPYASGITNNAGTVSFILNESADSVQVNFDNGARILNLNTNSGTQSFAMGTNLSYKIIAKKTAASGWTQISDDLNPLNRFWAPRGIAVNRNPASPRFGRIYVLETAAGGGSGTTAGPSASNRTVNEGIYILNADSSDALGYGNVGQMGGLQVAGSHTNTFFYSSSVSAFRIEVGQDDHIYIGDFNNTYAGLFRVDADAGASSGEIVLDGVGLGGNPAVHTTMNGSALATGSLANGNLTVWAVDGQWSGGFNSLLRWDIGSGPLPFTGAPTRISGTGIGSSEITNCDLDKHPDGNFYVSQYRANNDVGGVRVIAPDGTTLWTSKDSQGGTNDLFTYTRAVAISPDGTKLAIMDNSGSAYIVGLTNGPSGRIPDLSKTNYFYLFDSTPQAKTTSNTGPEIAWDAAGNLYGGSSRREKLRIFSPGGYSEATTGSDGTFTVFTPSSNVSVASGDATAGEAGANTGTFTITRSGETNVALTVNFTLSGTASTNDYNHAALGNSVVIPVGATSATVTVTPVNDSEAELAESVILTIGASVTYTPAAPLSATVTIVDDEAATVNISASQPTCYERVSGDYATFRVTRLGSTNSAVTANISFSGVAVNGTDYSSTNVTVAIDAGVVNTSFTISPLDDATLEGDETVVCSVVSGSGYNVGTTNSATATILDDELPTETAIFSDSLEADTSANWTTRFGANNGIDGDYQSFFGYDYSFEGVPTAPGAASNAGLKLTVNKNEATGFGAAGINLYPVGQTFSNNYAVRFQMYLKLNAGVTTEQALFGINHSGNKTNWFRESTGNVTVAPTDSDGIWYAIYADASQDHWVLTGTNAVSAPTVLASVSPESLDGVFKQPPHTLEGAPNDIWADVEISQVGNVVTLKINQSVIFQTVNTTPFTSGNIMLGYNDSYDSNTGTGGAVYYRNLRVIQLANVAPQAPQITGVQLINNGTQVQISFTGAAGDAAGAFTLVRSTTVNGSYTDAGATITGSNGSYTATTSFSAGNNYFYRIGR